MIRTTTGHYLDSSVRRVVVDPIDVREEVVVAFGRLVSFEAQITERVWV